VCRASSLVQLRTTVGPQTRSVRPTAGNSVQLVAKGGLRVGLVSNETHTYTHSVDPVAVHVRLPETSSGICVVTAATGETYLYVANVTAASKIGYADKWNYSYLQYGWTNPDGFLDWCHGTELGSRFPRQDMALNNPTIKYCVAHHAVTAMGCRRILFTDADAVVLNWNIEVNFSWPGAVMASSGKPYVMYATTDRPQGTPVRPDLPDRFGWCASHSPCSSFKTFWSCFNSGAFIMDNSLAARDYTFRMLDGVINRIDTKHACSTLPLHPTGRDQCGVTPAGTVRDQCISGCAWQLEERGDEDQMPHGVMCVPPSSPRFQQVLHVGHIHNIPDVVEADTFIVNVACGPHDKQLCVDALVEQMGSV